MALHIQLAKIPGLTACANWEGNTWENLVAHPQVQEGTYCLKEAFVLGARFLGLRHQLGDRILEFFSPTGSGPLYLFAQAHPFGVNRNAIGVPGPLFEALWRTSKESGISLEVTRVWWSSSIHWVQGPRSNELIALDAYISKEHVDAPEHAPSARPTWSLPLQAHVEGDSLFKGLYPQVPSVYQPHSLLAWFAWLMHRRDALDKAHEGPVSCFSHATRQSIVEVPDAHGDELQVKLFNGDNQVVSEFRVTLEGASLMLKTIEGFTFYLKDAGDYPVLYFSDGTTAFSWDGGTQLKTGAPAQVMDPTMLSRQK